MILLLKYWLRHIIFLCLIVAIAFMVACAVFVIACAIRGDIKISIIKSENDKEKK